MKQQVASNRHDAKKHQQLRGGCRKNRVFLMILARIWLRHQVCNWSDERPIHYSCKFFEETNNARQSTRRTWKLDRTSCW